MTIQQFFKQLSRKTLAILSVTAGIIFILLNDPPNTVCDSQIEKFKNSQNGFLYLQPTDNKKSFTPKVLGYFEKTNFCKRRNSAGACYALFSNLSDMIAELNLVDKKCQSQLSETAPVKPALIDSYKLMVQLPWGGAPPETEQRRRGWYSRVDMGLFCDLKLIIANLYGDGQLNGLNQSLLASLPGAKELGRNEAWQRMLASESCKGYSSF